MMDWNVDGAFNPMTGVLQEDRNLDAEEHR